MSFQAPITIKEAIEHMDKKKYLLPAIQREFVWSTFQVARLFDSLMKNYPIGSFLFWQVEQHRKKDYQFYEFLRNYHEKNNTHNPKADLHGTAEITAILDGQQRLTSLYVGLKGTYAYKLPRKYWNNDAAFPKRKLYLNLLKKADNLELEFDFQFLTDEEAKVQDEDNFWFRVGDILDIEKEVEVNRYLIKNGLTKYGDEKFELANDILFKLHSVFQKEKIINYYLEKDDDLDKVLNIFIRVNSAGTELSYSDLLLSIATAQWQEKDAREEIIEFVDELNNIGDGFNLNKDLVLKACLVLNDFKDIRFKVDNFNKKNMLLIEKKWEQITEALRVAIKLLNLFGYNRYSLTANYVVIPIAYFIFKNKYVENFLHSNNFVEERKKIQKWVALSLLKRIYGGHADHVLSTLRNAIASSDGSFPKDEIVKGFRGTTKAVEFNDEEIENLFLYKYGQSYLFSTLTLLYPNLDYRNVFHIDHIYPKSFFTRKRLQKRGINENNLDFYLNNFDYLANLQLLEGIPNIEKSNKDFHEWLLSTFKDDSSRRDYMRKNFIPENIELSLENFEEFIKMRKKLMVNRFRDILKI